MFSKIQADIGAFEKDSALYEEENFDLDLEHRFRQERRTVEPAWHESWVRRLADVSRLTIGKAQVRPDSFGRPTTDQLNYSDVVIDFRDGTIVDLGLNQSRLDEDDYQNTDAVIGAIRQHANL